MKRTYEVRDRADKRAIREFLKREGQFLLPMLELVEQTEVAIDEVIQVMGRATIEAVLEMSAEGVAGVKQPGRRQAVRIGGKRQHRELDRGEHLPPGRGSAARRSVVTPGQLLLSGLHCGLLTASGSGRPAEARRLSGQCTRCIGRCRTRTWSP